MTALVSRLTQDIQDLRQDKEYLRADVARLQAELDRERAEKERYRRRARELEELLEKGNAQPPSVKPEQFSSKLVGTVRKSPSLEITGFTEPPSPPHSVVDVDEPMEGSKPPVTEGEVDYESHDPNFAHLGDRHVQDEVDLYPSRADNTLRKRKVSDGSMTPHPSSKKPRSSHQPSESGTAPSPPLHPPSVLAPQPDALQEPSPSHTANPSNTSNIQQQHAPLTPPTPVPPLPFRPRANLGVGTSSLSAPAVPVPPLPFRPRPVRNFKIKEEEAVTLPTDIVANYLQDVPPFSINPDPSDVPFVSRKFLAKVYGGSDRQFLQYIEVPSTSSVSASSPSTSSTFTPAASIPPTRRRKPLMFPTPEMNPSMPLFPGDPGLIFTSRTEILKNGPWTVFRKKGTGKGKQKSVVWVYLGDYECTKVGRISKEEWAAQNDEVKKRWVKRVASKMTGCYLSMRARIGLRKAGIVPGSSSTSTSSSNSPTSETHDDDVGADDSTNNVSTSPPSSSTTVPSAEHSTSTSPTHQEQSDEDPDARYERLLHEEISAHRSRKPRHPITEHDILEALNRGEEGVDIVQLKCVAYDWEWVRDFEGRWERGERGKWWEGDDAGDDEEETGEGRDEASVKRQRADRTRSTLAVDQGALRRSGRTVTNARARGQVQAEQDAGAHEHIDTRGEATTAVALQLPPQPVPNAPPTSPQSIAASTTGPLDPASRPSEMNLGTARFSSEQDEGGGDIDDGYLSYVSEAEEMEMGSGGLDSLSDLTDLEGGDEI
ncbi:hypothetical protein EST38_g12906 [Candolleomyces aberdarensis]|uniref:DUF6697 domain-containing protein n=1 Tax=Candolleomyces aberdarensis TaxID=2316362 RepID=A0A4Q2D213_9AGAR|nr:hypothetical protein EST38_g12906 [Candolleomyces aberdarensis]